MNNDQVKGTVNDAAGRAKRQVGEWTGDKDAQVEGSVQQIKGKAQKVLGDVKEATYDAAKDLENEAEREREFERARIEREEEAHAHHSH